MEVILTIVLFAVVIFFVYKAFAPNLDTKKDGKIDQAEVKAAVEAVKAAVEASTAAVEEIKAKTTAAVKKATTYKTGSKIPKTSKK